MQINRITSWPMDFWKRFWSQSLWAKVGELSGLGIFLWIVNGYGIVSQSLELVMYIPAAVALFDETWFQNLLLVISLGMVIYGIIRTGKLLEKETKAKAFEIEQILDQPLNKCEQRFHALAVYMTENEKLGLLLKWQNTLDTEFAKLPSLETVHALAHDVAMSLEATDAQRIRLISGPKSLADQRERFSEMFTEIRTEAYQKMERSKSLISKTIW